VSSSSCFCCVLFVKSSGSDLNWIREQLICFGFVICESVDACHFVRKSRLPFVKMVILSTDNPHFVCLDVSNYQIIEKA
jgi:hypothetical protein